MPAILGSSRFRRWRYNLRLDDNTFPALEGRRDRIMVILLVGAAKTFRVLCVAISTPTTLHGLDILAKTCSALLAAISSIVSLLRSSAFSTRR